MTDTVDTSAEAVYLIVKRDLYYMPNSCGYTGIKELAGRYTLDEVSVRFPNMDSPNQDGVYCIHEDLADDYSKACSQDIKVGHMMDKVEAERDTLRAELAAARNAALDDTIERMRSTWTWDDEDWFEGMATDLRTLEGDHRLRALKTNGGNENG